MKRTCVITFLIIILFFLQIISFAEEQIVVGIIEFEEKTGIGQENASVIVPELLIVQLKKIGAYTLVE